MTSPGDQEDQPVSAADALMEETVARLRSGLGEMAARLRPFPAFMGMTTLQAVELEPPPGAPAGQGCVVVLPEGSICALELKVEPVAQGIEEIDSVEELTELELSPEDYIIYASAAIRLLYQEVRRRGQ